MMNLKSGLCWTGALLLLALGNATGLVADKAAEVLFVVLPIVAIASMGGTSCHVRKGAFSK